MLQNEWDRRISAGVEEEPADCIRISEVIAAMRKMEQHKAPGCHGW